MDRHEIERLISAFNEGVIEPEELTQLELLIEKGEVDITKLNSLREIDQQWMNLATPAPSADLDARFYQMLRKEKSASWSWSWRMSQLHVWVPRLAFAFLFALIGFSAGYWLKPADGAQVSQLTQEVSDLKEMVMLSLLEKESATERLRAVSLT